MYFSWQVTKKGARGGEAYFLLQGCSSILALSNAQMWQSLQIYLRIKIERAPGAFLCFCWCSRANYKSKYVWPTCPTSKVMWACTENAVLLSFKSLQVKSPLKISEHQSLSCRKVMYMDAKQELNLVLNCCWENWLAGPSSWAEIYCAKLELEDRGFSRWKTAILKVSNFPSSFLFMSPRASSFRKHHPSFSNQADPKPSV